MCACACLDEDSDVDVWPEVSRLNDQMDALICSPAPDGDEEEKYKQVYLMAIRSLPLYEQVYGQFHPDLTVQLMRAVKARANMRQVPDEYLSTDASSEHSLVFLMQKLRQCLQVTHSPDHPICHEFRSFFH